jgi:hypothetical protein
MKERRNGDDDSLSGFVLMKERKKKDLDIIQKTVDIFCCWPVSSFYLVHIKKSPQREREDVMTSTSK